MVLSSISFVGLNDIMFIVLNGISFMVLNDLSLMLLTSMYSWVSHNISFALQLGFSQHG